MSAHIRSQRGLAALFAAGLLLAPAVSKAGVFIGISVAPPVLPVYVQPPCPAEGYIWTPGFWQWDPEVADYYWIPGTWVLAPQPGYLWTPGYWAFNDGFYGWRQGYWGPHVGFYGGVNYGFGYFGSGFEGGRWDHDRFFYNTAYSRVNVTNIHNTYINNVTVVNNHNTFNRISYNGGNGIQAQPGRTETVAMREQHLQPTAMQQTHFAVARQDRSQFQAANHGAPPAAALMRPAASVTGFHQNAVAARPFSGAASAVGNTALRPAAPAPAMNANPRGPATPGSFGNAVPPSRALPPQNQQINNAHAQPLAPVNRPTPIQNNPAAPQNRSFANGGGYGNARQPAPGAVRPGYAGGSYGQADPVMARPQPQAPQPSRPQGQVQQVQPGVRSQPQPPQGGFRSQPQGGFRPQPPQPAYRPQPQVQPQQGGFRQQPQPAQPNFRSQPQSAPAMRSAPEAHGGGGGGRQR